MNTLAIQDGGLHQDCLKVETRLQKKEIHLEVSQPYAQKFYWKKIEMKIYMQSVWGTLVLKGAQGHPHVMPVAETPQQQAFPKRQANNEWLWAQGVHNIYIGSPPCCAQQGVKLLAVF